MTGMSKKKPRPTPQPAEYIPQLVDAHTHLTSCGAHTSAEVGEFVQRAVDAGVEKICTVGDGVEESALALEAAHVNDRVWAACALHPTRAHELDDAAKKRLADMAADPRCVAVGETGIDTYWIHHEPEKTATIEQQEESLRWHSELAKKVGKPLMIHNREGDEELFRILDDAPQPDTIILHCFSSPLAAAKKALERGYILSFAGTVTFQRNTEMREAAGLAPEGQLLIETDAPYMTPEPYRGTRNEPAFIGHTAKCVAEARGQSVADVAAEVSATFDRVYGL